MLSLEKMVVALEKVSIAEAPLLFWSWFGFGFSILIIINLINQNGLNVKSLIENYSLEGTIILSVLISVFTHILIAALLSLLTWVVKTAKQPYNLGGRQQYEPNIVHASALLTIGVVAGVPGLALLNFGHLLGIVPFVLGVLSIAISMTQVFSANY